MNQDLLSYAFIFGSFNYFYLKKQIMLIYVLIIYFERYNVDEEFMFFYTYNCLPC